MLNPTYPGVYVEELPSGDFTITGVSTAVTAFIGRAIMGPINTPATCFGLADFEAQFGGRRVDLPMSYAVEDFFLNGGSEAIIVRVQAAPPSAAALVADADALAATASDSTSASTAGGAGAQSAAEKPDDATPDKDAAASTDAASSSAATADASTPTAKPAPTPYQTAAAAAAAASPGSADAATKLTAAYAAAKTAGSTLDLIPPAAATLTLDGLVLTAASPGLWGNALTAQIDTTGLTQAVTNLYGANPDNSFNLTLAYTSVSGLVTEERFTALNTVEKSPNRVDKVLNKQSNFVRTSWPQGGMSVSAPAPTKPPTAPAKFDGGLEGGMLADTDILGDPAGRTGLYALEHVDLFNILVIPPDQRTEDTPKTVNAAAAAYCASRRAMYLVDGPLAWRDKALQNQLSDITDPGEDLDITDQASQQCTAVYFPRIMKPDPEQSDASSPFSACGVIAGQMARTDANRGVWKAPAGTAAAMGGVTALEVNLTDPQQGLLNPIGVNCLRSFRVLGPLVWGARTLRGADLMSDDYKYVPVRRLAHYIEESLRLGLKFAVFEPNDEALWSQLRLTVNSFMSDLSRQGAFYNYAVMCDATTTTPYHIDRGICVVKVAFAPVKPAEFIVLQIQQQAIATAS